jgi:hypothetical protein
MKILVTMLILVRDREKGWFPLTVHVWRRVEGGWLWVGNVPGAHGGQLDRAGGYGLHLPLTLSGLALNKREVCDWMIGGPKEKTERRKAVLWIRIRMDTKLLVGSGSGKNLSRSGSDMNLK